MSDTEQKPEEMQVPEINATYLTRIYPEIGEPDLRRVRVTRVTKLGDGSTIVTYRYGIVFQTIIDIELNRFLKNTEVV